MDILPKAVNYVSSIKKEIVCCFHKFGVERTNNLFFVLLIIVL